jgi:hypothetical protein
VAKTFFMQPRQYHRGYPGLLHLVIAPAPRKLKYPTGHAGLNLLDSSQHNIFLRNEMVQPIHFPARRQARFRASSRAFFHIFTKFSQKWQ